MNSQWARNKAINLMNEEGKELTVEFLMNQLAIEDCNAHKQESVPVQFCSITLHVNCKIAVFVNFRVLTMAKTDTKVKTRS